jgi:hypothetical protein
MYDVRNRNGFWKNLKALYKFHRGSGFCLRCGLTYEQYKKDHCIRYDGPNGACPLCENCYQELKTADKRFPYFEILIREIWGKEDRSILQEIKLNLIKDELKGGV